MDWFDYWGADPGGLHPGRRHGDRAADPEGARSTLKVVALADHAGDARGRGRDPRPASTTTGPARLQFQANKSWIDVIHSRYHVGIDGISLPLVSSRCW